MNLIASPHWASGVPASGYQPPCNYDVTTTGSQTTLNYGTPGVGFGLGLQPAAGIAVNQGSIASGTITIKDINGFNGSVDVVPSNLPSGVTAQLAPDGSFNTYTLTLSASSLAALTGANPPAVATLTASAAGVPTQAFPLNVIVNPPLTGGTGTVVDLTSAFNVYGLVDDNDTGLNATDSIDGSGDAYSANQLSPPGTSSVGLNMNGVQFSFGTPNQPNAVYGTGSNPVLLPNIQAGALEMLGAGVNSMQTAQTIIVTYTDHTTQTFTQTFHDWDSGGSPCASSNPCAGAEAIAAVMPYRDPAINVALGSGYANDRIFYLYSYTFQLDSSKTVSSVMLPDNRDVVVLAAALLTPASTPTLSPAAGTYNSVQSVTISDTTPGATIYYTTDASTPTTSSMSYTGPIAVSSSETLKAIAAAGGYAPSVVASASYTINLPPAASTPSFSPAAGTYNSVQSVTISDTTPGATIYYTTDASTPTTGSMSYTGPIAVSSSATLKAIAAAGGYLPSVAASASYTISLPSFTVSGSAASVSSGSTTTATVMIQPVNGFTGTVALTAAVTSAPSGAQNLPTVSFGTATPVSITGASAASATLSIGTTATTAFENHSGQFPWSYGGGVVLAQIVFLLIPRRRRVTRHLFASMAVLLLIGGLVACGGGSGGSSGGSSGGGGGVAGTTAGAYVITITATSGSIVETGTVNLSVQ